MLKQIEKFEKELAEFTNSPYAIVTDCCTHAIELCLLLEQTESCSFTCYTYISVIMTMHKLGLNYELIDEDWIGEYNFYGTRIWDSARILKPNMFKKNQLQCLSFGYSKPLELGRGGAILTDSFEDYKTLKEMAYDGRNLHISPWINQRIFRVGYHYRLTPEECAEGSKNFKAYKIQKNFDPVHHIYPDCREITIL